MAYTGNTYPCCRVLVTFPTVDTVTVNLFEVCFVEEEKSIKEDFNSTPIVNQI